MYCKVYVFIFVCKVISVFLLGFLNYLWIVYRILLVINEKKNSSRFEFRYYFVFVWLF